MSSQVPVCNHRVYEVVIVFLLSIVAGLVAGLVWAALGMAPASAIGAGAAVFAGAFGLCMTAVAYVKKQTD
ncbi:hypothetical protein [Streptomyces cylindrosporus]|uniref:Uncharacterized protein n=1 Tax=Streptomyces cylindrosporus TaxID=2927583 RepID=A0ABS9YNE1_9ACTN|nr:hypothetical protein [Streptomyces cylindrosporus]MCI3278780.1 hypothetical protein [Streptomyces cylindrosporus]